MCCRRRGFKVRGNGVKILKKQEAEEFKMFCCLLPAVLIAKCYTDWSPLCEEHSPVLFVMQINVDDVYYITSVHLVRISILCSDQKRSGNVKKQALILLICYPVFLNKNYTLFVPFLFFN